MLASDPGEIRPAPAASAGQQHQQTPLGHDQDVAVADPVEDHRLGHTQPSVIRVAPHGAKLIRPRPAAVIVAAGTRAQRCGCPVSRTSGQ